MSRAGLKYSPAALLRMFENRQIEFATQLSNMQKQIQDSLDSVVKEHEEESRAHADRANIEATSKFFFIFFY